ncbi:T9SS type A sorting domain-containing protein [Dyadobacter pollutisoli]|uniref:T9SS type A sorting domain-containing protein n=1 Tax=Dyadobacter pollutisoli TaxID=2910158 RepID=A0A9E8SLN2_9BACT|nr:T9SS type A sorting domain-containing protein [Dyadobacter pollutisoli]WAC12389.1 T9SS type A sorting domain-containing protein [Dyadobacter pollutisoli]
MKKTILYLFILTALALQGLNAQSVSNGSRLNMVSKKKPASSENLKFTSMPTGLSYKPLSLQNPKALNSFYRSFLFSSAVSPESTNVLASEIVEKSIDKRSPALEAQLRAEELLYTSDKISVSNIYPNPASEYAEVDFSISTSLRDAKLIFYNVLGSKMEEFTLNKNDRKLRVNTRDMPTGLYFYQLSIDGKKVATKKMLVRHQQ